MSRAVQISIVAKMVHAIMQPSQQIDVFAASSRVKSWQKFGLWDANKVGKGVKGSYPVEAVQRAALMAELSNLGLGPAVASPIAHKHRERVFADGDQGKGTAIGIEGSQSHFMIDSPMLVRSVADAIGGAHG